MTARAGAVVVALLVSMACIARADADADGEAVRRAKVGKLAASTTRDALGRLERIVLEDPSASVRVHAARGLAQCKAKHATHTLCDLIQQGGLRPVRHELALSLAARKDGLGMLGDAVALPSIDAVGRANLVAALGRFGGAASLTVLQEYATHTDVVVRVAALDALELREDGRAMLPAVVELALTRFKDDSTVLRCLELMETFDLAEMEALQPLLAKAARRTTVRNVGYLKRRLEFLRLAAEFERTEGTIYAIPEPYEPEPPTWERHDLVFVFDATGSEAGHLEALREAIWAEMITARAEGMRLRVGFVAYRDKLRDMGQRLNGWKVRVLPLTSDHEAARAWLAELRAGGVNDRASLISEGLFQGLARINWRHDAYKRLELVTATDLDDKRRVRELVRLHVLEGDISMRVRYRPLGVRSPALRQLAESLGTKLEEF